MDIIKWYGSKNTEHVSRVTVEQYTPVYSKYTMFELINRYYLGWVDLTGDTFEIWI